LEREGSRRFEPIDILELILAEKAKLWVIWDDEEKTAIGAAVTEIVHYPRLNELRVWLVAGRKMSEWGRRGAQMMEEFARANGCAYVTGGFRRGWIRIGGEGWRETGCAFEKKL
jgi:hypothetical protein